MNLELFEQMEAPELRNSLEFFLRHYRVMDEFWFIYLADTHCLWRFNCEARI